MPFRSQGNGLTFSCVVTDFECFQYDEFTPTAHLCENKTSPTEEIFKSSEYYLRGSKQAFLIALAISHAPVF